VEKSKSLLKTGPCRSFLESGSHMQVRLSAMAEMGDETAPEIKCMFVIASGWRSLLLGVMSH
jgi:hypothetical protein